MGAATAWGGGDRAMTGSTTKKVMIARFSREPVAGFVNPQSYLRETGVELITPSGSVGTITYSEVKAVCFVRDFQEGDPLGERRAFHVRPKINGLWVRLQFRDGDALEGMMLNSLLQVEPQGISVIPPDLTGNSQRVFVPRLALRDAQVLGVIGSPLRKLPRESKKPPKEQISLFD
jgi:hypothetical protein